MHPYLHVTVSTVLPRDGRVRFFHFVRYSFMKDPFLFFQLLKIRFCSFSKLSLILHLFDLTERSFGKLVLSKRMSNPDMGSIFHIKNQ